MICQEDWRGRALLGQKQDSQQAWLTQGLGRGGTEAGPSDHPPAHLIKAGSRPSPVPGGGDPPGVGRADQRRAAVAGA